MKWFAPLRKWVSMKNVSTQVNRSKIYEKHTGILKEAQKVIGEQQFLNYSVLLSQLDIESYIKRLIEAKHPLLKKLESISSDVSIFGLIVYLFSKAVETDHETALESHLTKKISQQQRSLAEITEKMRLSNLLHLEQINSRSSLFTKNMLFGNKLSVLSGDYLLGTCFHDLAQLNNFHVQELMSSALRDLSESQFIGLRDKNNRPLPSEPLPEQEEIVISPRFGMEPFDSHSFLGNMKAEWVFRNLLSGGTLLGKSCKGVAVLGNSELNLQELGYIFGSNVALAFQLSLEIDLFKEGKFEYIHAPVMFHLEDDRELYKEIRKGFVSAEKINYNLIKDKVFNGSGLEKSENLLKHFSKNTLCILDKLPDNKTKSALINIINKL